MPYKHISGGNVDYGDSPTDMGEALADKYKQGVLEDYYKKLEEWRDEVDKVKLENKKLTKLYNSKIKLWNQKNLFYKIIFFFKKPKINLISEKEEPRKPF